MKLIVLRLGMVLIASVATPLIKLVGFILISGRMLFVMKLFVEQSLTRSTIYFRSLGSLPYSHHGIFKILSELPYH